MRLIKLLFFVSTFCFSSLYSAMVLTPCTIPAGKYVSSAVLYDYGTPSLNYADFSPASMTIPAGTTAYDCSFVNASVPKIFIITVGVYSNAYYVGSAKKSYAILGCTKTSADCLPNQELNTTTCTCQDKCLPPQGFTALPIPKSQCFNKATVNNINYVELVWQECDQTCYGVKYDFGSCEEAFTAFQRSCNPVTNDATFSCSQLDGQAPDVHSSCIPKEDPCEKVLSDLQINCKAPNIIDAGQYGCISANGVITQNTFTCKPPLPHNNPCDTEFKNLSSTCSYPSYVVGDCTDNGIDVVSSNRHCFTPVAETTTNTPPTDYTLPNAPPPDGSTGSTSGDVYNSTNNINNSINNQTNNINNSINNQTSNINNNVNNQTSNINNTINNNAAATNNKLDGIAENSAATNANISNTNSKLDSLNGALTDGINSINNNFNNGVDSLLGRADLTNSKLDNLINNSNASNLKLDDIKDAINDKNLSVDLSSTNGLLSDIKGLLQNESNNSSGGDQTAADCGFWNETFNTTTKQCECDPGWSRNINNSCLIDDSNSTTNKLLASIDESLKDDANASGDTIQDDTLSKGFFDFGEHAYDNIRSQFDSVNSLVDGGFTNNLPTSNISTCAFSRDFSFLDSTIPIEFDVCKVISPVYPVLYFVFYILFFSTFLSFVFSILIRTDGR